MKLQTIFSRRLLHLVSVALFASSVVSAVFAQETSSTENVSVRFGFGGELVADAWNPVQVTLRDQQAAELILELNVGNLREGTKTLRYSAELSGGAGLYTFSDDIYLPAWRTFSWLVRTPSGVLASGSLERRRSDPDPLQLVLAREVSEGNRYFSGAQRVVDVLPEELPERAAAYDGVRSLLLLPSARPPSAAAVTAAATSGATVVLAGTLGNAHSELLNLAAQPAQRLGAGWLVRVPTTEPGAVEQGLANEGIEPETLLPALLSPELLQTPPNPSVVLLLAVLGGYALLVVVLLRFGSLPGLVGALLLAALLSFGAQQLRPETLLLSRSRTLSVGAGELALVLDLETLFSYPTQTARLPYPLHPLDLSSVQRWSVGPESLTLELPRYQSLALFGRPRLDLATLAWSDGSLVNRSERSLGGVFAEASGAQAALPAGASMPLQNGNLIPPDLYSKLIPLLPEGSAVARDGGTFYIALPSVPEGQP